MKRALIIILILFLSGVGTLSAQHYIGVKGGTGFSYGRFYPKRDMNTVVGVHSFGIAWKYYSSYKYDAGVNKIAGGVSAELELMQRAFDYTDISGQIISDTAYYRRKVNTLALPIMCQPHISFGRNNGIRVFLNAGIVLTYNLSSKEYIYYKDRQLYSSQKYEFDRLRDVRFGYGITGGPGVNVAIGRWELTVEARYYFDMGDILRNRNDYPKNSTYNSQIDKVTIYFGLFYRLGSNEKYGIKRRTTAKAVRRANRAREVEIPLDASPPGESVAASE